jgi:hypothetical protein
MTDHCLAGDSAKGRRHRLRGRLCAEWIAAAEEERHGRPMTAEDGRGAGAAPSGAALSHLITPPGLWHVSLRRIRAGGPDRTE